jgi:hypothetical protein
MKPYLYIRGLRHADHTVFCVQDGQKYYYDNQFQVRCAYSSGQQVKRSIISTLMENMNEPEAPITFNYELSTEKNKITEKTTLGHGEPWSPCDPSFTDQLLGGWMRASASSTTVKRRSPLSISAMRPLHPLLGGMTKENATFDRSSNPDRHPVRVRDSKGNELSTEEIQDFLTSTSGRTLNRRNWIPELARTTGLFVYDLAIDMRTLFSVSLNTHEPEVDSTIAQKLRDNGWIESRNIFGACLVAPKERRDKIIGELAHGLLNWRITTNQARTFSPMETLAVAISDNANRITGSIRARIDDEKEKLTALPMLDPGAGAELYITLSAGGYIAGATGSADALEQAEQSIKTKLEEFDYEHQAVPA